MSVLVPAVLAAGAVAVLLSPGPAPQRMTRLARAAPPAGSRCSAVARSRWPAPHGRLLPPFVTALLLLTLGAGVVPALLGAGVALAVVRGLDDRRRAAGRAEERARAVEACATLAAELRAGRSPAQALEVAAGLACGPSRQALAAGAAAGRLGGDVAAALRAPSTGTAVPEVLRALAACWTVCAGSGSGLATAVERLEEGLRADAAQRRAVSAELAGPRATAGMLAVLPAAGLLLAAGLGADPLRVLLHTPVGLVCLVLGVGLDGLGLWWTGRLVARAGGSG